MPDVLNFSLSADNYVKKHPGIRRGAVLLLVYLVMLIGLASR